MTQKIFFTSDHHFLHPNIVQTRPELETLEAMTEAYIARWNGMISKHDLVYHLGDFALSWGKAKSLKPITGILKDLNGRKFLIKGNHDRGEVIKQHYWESVSDLMELKIDLGGEHKQRIVLCHYPMRSWNQAGRGAWMLHGHCHNNLTDLGGKILDVGVDGHDGFPWEIDEVKMFMDQRPISFGKDHHAPSGDPWLEDPTWPSAEWRDDVRAGDTRLGYQDWVLHNKESEEHENTDTTK